MTNDEARWPVFANGRFVDPDEPVLVAGDQGFTLGLSVFDSLLCEDGTLLFLEDHLARLERGARGAVTAAVMGGVRFERRSPGAPDGEQFTIDALYPANELRARALAASPPDEEGEFVPADLVDLATAAPDLYLEVRYATTNNFLETVFYPSARAFLQRPAAAALEEARADVQKAEEGNKAATSRVRKAMQEVKACAQDVRKEMLELRDAGGKS